MRQKMHETGSSRVDFRREKRHAVTARMTFGAAKKVGGLTTEERETQPMMGQSGEHWGAPGGSSGTERVPSVMAQVRVG